MTRSLTLADGRAVELGDRTPGGSKNHTRYGVMPTGEQVVVKIQATHGQLPTEEAALRYLAQHGLRVPRVVSFATTADGACFLALSREPGGRPTEPGGWYRLGRDLAAVPRVPVDDCRLRRRTATEFVTEHLEHLDVVTPLLSGKMRRAIAAAIRQFEGSDQLVLTHGDPGGGNYLEQHDQGVILDWETASVGPYGLDAGRAAFIALLDNGHTGIPEQLHAAVVRGYHDGLPADRALTGTPSPPRRPSPRCSSSMEGTSSSSDQTGLHESPSTCLPRTSASGDRLSRRHYGGRGWEPCVRRVPDEVTTFHRLRGAALRSWASHGRR